MLASSLKMSEITSLTIAVKWGRGVTRFSATCSSVENNVGVLFTTQHVLV